MSEANQAAMFPISRSGISKIKNHKSWKHAQN